MNNNICQFYVIFGNRNFNPPTNNNVYIDANNIKNLKELQVKIIDAYKEKSKLGFKVGSEIIFIIPNEKYRQKTEEIIKQLKVNGKIEIMNQKKEQEPVVNNKINPIRQVKPLEIKETKVETAPQNITEINTFPKQQIQSNITNIEKKEEIKLEQTPIEQEIAPPKKDNIYRGTVDSTTYTNLNKSKKNNKIAIIIFVISLIFFIASLVLLFFM